MISRFEEVLANCRDGDLLKSSHTAAQNKNAATKHRGRLHFCTSKLPASVSQASCINVFCCARPCFAMLKASRQRQERNAHFQGMRLIKCWQVTSIEDTDILRPMAAVRFFSCLNPSTCWKPVSLSPHFLPRSTHKNHGHGDEGVRGPL